MARTYNDPVKSKSRDKLRRFIRTHLIGEIGMNPENIKVVCLPGAEAEGEEGIEVTEVYDKLGIPRRNVLGLESNRKIHTRLRAADLGIRLTKSPQSDLNFFRQTDERFDVVSLDYTGQQTVSRLEALAHVVGRPILAKNAILCTNYSGKRESMQQQEDMQLRHAVHATLDNSYWGGGVPRGNAHFQQLREARNQALEENHGEWVRMAARGELRDLEFLRDSITLTTISYMALGRLALAHHTDDVRACYAGSFEHFYDEVLEFAREIFEEDLLTLYGEEMLDLVARGNGRKSFREILENPAKLVQGFTELLVDEYVRQAKRRWPTVTDMPLYLIGTSILQRDANMFRISALERYGYESNTNYLMMMDMLAVNEPYRLWQRLDDVMEHLRSGEPLSRVVRGREKPVPAWTRFLQESRVALTLEWQLDLPSRVFLGSSYQRPEKITRADAEDLFALGCSPKEVYECWPNSFKSWQQVAGWRAAMTRKENGG